MTIFGCKQACISIATVASILIGVVAAFLRIMAVIIVTPAFLWVTFGVAVAWLAGLLFGSLVKNETCCRTALSAILIGSLGTVLSSVVLLAIPFVATSVVGAILTGVLLFFFSLMLAASACRIRQCL